MRRYAVQLYIYKAGWVNVYTVCAISICWLGVRLRPCMYVCMRVCVCSSLHCYQVPVCICFCTCVCVCMSVSLLLCDNELINHSSVYVCVCVCM